MDISFCSICNESIPQSDLAAGRAVRRGSGVVCSACEQGMGAVAVAAPPPAPGMPPVVEVATARPAMGSLAVPLAACSALVVACAAAVGAILVWKSAGERVLRLEQSDDRLDARLAADSRRAAASEALLQASRDEVSRLRTTLDAHAATSDELQAQLSLAREALESLAGRADEADRLRERLARLEAMGPRLRDLEDKLGAAEEAREGLQARLAQLEGAARESARSSEPAPAPAAPARPAWDTRLADLTSPSEAARLEAVLALSATKDPAAAPHLVPRLKDDNLFVRTAAARALGELRAIDQAAVLALCDALVDAETPVREAAWVALRAITGFNLAYDPDGNAAELARRAKAWREQVEKGPPPGRAPADGG